MEPEVSIPYSQEPTTEPCLEPDESSSRRQILFHLYLVSQLILTKFYIIIYMRATCSAHFILLDLMKMYYEALQY